MIMHAPFVSVLVSTFLPDAADLKHRCREQCPRGGRGGGVCHVDFEAGYGAGKKHREGQEDGEELHGGG